MKHRSIRYLAKGGVEIIEASVKDPQPGEVQIRGLACGVCAWDVHVYTHGSDWPTCPGHEGVGEIVRIGEGVSRFKEGDWVTGMGMGFSEVCNMSAHSLFPIPRNGTKPEDWIVEPVSCIVTGLDHCALRAGDRIAVLGCGFMGLMFVQGLSRSLVSRLVAIDVDPRRLEMAREFGATDLVDARMADLGALQAMGLDTVVDCSGSQAGLDMASKIVRQGGGLNLFGWNHGTGKFPRRHLAHERPHRRQLRAQLRRARTPGRPPSACSSATSSASARWCPTWCRSMNTPRCWPRPPRGKTATSRAWYDSPTPTEPGCATV